jgi:hypothetical protein
MDIERLAQTVRGWDYELIRDRDQMRGATPSATS